MTLNRIVEPSISIPDTLSFKHVEEIILKNKVPLYVLNAGTQELCKVEIVFKAGELYSQTSLVATAVNDLLDSGTKNKTAFEIAEAFDYYGAYLQTESNSDYASVKLYTLNKHLGKTLPLLKEILTEAIFPQDELATYQQQNYQRLKINNEKVDYLARKKFYASIFNPQHPYGYEINEGHYKSLSSDLLLDFYQKSYPLNNSFVLVSGKFSNKDLSVIENHFEDYPVSDNKSSTLFTAPQQSFIAHQKIKIEKENAVQSAIRIGRSWHDKTQPAFQNMIITTTILGGYFGSRLMKNIREDKGYTYGIGCSVSSFLQSGFISISTQVGIDVCERAINEIYKEIEMLRTTTVGLEELTLVKNYLFGTFQRSIDGAFALADKFKNIKVFDLGYDYYYNYLKLLKDATPDMVLKTAVDHLNPENLFEVAVG
ncbi:MAG TPA: pitrilysin family protein [Bacteroidia bacterium]|nr:pitrilysin family protein [Bacteroidia bacterium]HNU33551.1 pitrilysin family protein [Bacteroidia bacterium]